jgi:hypothetical protein
MEELNKEKQDTYLSTLIHYADMADRRAQSNEYELQIIRFAESLKVVPVKDGTQWCAMYGENLQVGIAGFGDTPFKAIEALRDEFYKQS